MSRYIIHPEIESFLDAFSLKLGASKVRESLKGYLLRKSGAGETPTKRKSIPRKWIADAFVRQKGICPRCGDDMNLTGIAGDHRVALIHGGKHAKHNIQAMHRDCNASKRDNDFLKEARLTGQTVYETLKRSSGL